jgi:predicted nucleic acid-binding protein
LNVFVESNFILEIALEQREAPACEGILRLAEASTIHLLLPAYSFVEVHETLTRRRIERGELTRRITTELNQLARSTPLSDRVTASREVLRLLTDATAYESARIDDVKRRIRRASDLLPLNAEVLAAAGPWQSTFDLSPQDAAVYASIRGRLERPPQSLSAFVSRNPRDFAKLSSDLALLNCRYFSSFTAALAWLERDAIGE